MTKEELAKSMAAFQASGGKVKEIKESERAIDPAIRNCRCGCNGNCTDHTMRAGESGRYN